LLPPPLFFWVSFIAVFAQSGAPKLGVRVPAAITAFDQKLIQFLGEEVRKTSEEIVETVTLLDEEGESENFLYKHGTTKGVLNPKKAWKKLSKSYGNNEIIEVAVAPANKPTFPSTTIFGERGLHTFKSGKKEKYFPGWWFISDCCSTHIP
jgi:hypothetical protein